MTQEPAQEPVELKPLLDYESVRTWIEGLEKHWGGDPVADDP